MLTLKKTILSFILLYTFQLFGNTTPPTTISHFISGSYEEFGVKINYSAVVNTKLVKNISGEQQLDMYLSSFLIEEAKYNNKTYRDNDIFGISFPIDIAVKINAEVQLLYGNKLLNKTTTIQQNKKTVLDLNITKADFDKIRISAKKTFSIISLHSHETFIDDIKKGIDQNTSPKDPITIEKEHMRLMILGNNYLNENNYKAAAATYQQAKKYANDNSYAEAQIATTIKYAQKNNIVIDTSYASLNIKSNDYKTTKQLVTNKKTNERKYSNNDDEYTTPQNTEKESPVYAVNEDDQNAEYEYEYDNISSTKKVKIDTFDDLEYEYEYDNVKKEISNSEIEIDPNIEYETEDGKPIIVNNSQPSIAKSTHSSKPINNSHSIDKTLNEQNKPDINQPTSNQIKQEGTVDTTTPPEENFEIITTKKGYIKYRKDEQAVVDKAGNIMIPYGKYEILRFRAGFARIKIKDDVDIKNIVCIDKNEEYTWSARIYENPWKETVIDKDGRYVDKTVKKVEIYIVDNVTNIPNSELSPELLKRYEDPNPFKGTKQISALNLWNRDNADDPTVIQQRAEIERLKQISKNDAFLGAEKCRNLVSKSFEAVFNYYQDLGYEIILKN